MARRRRKPAVSTRTNSLPAGLKRCVDGIAGRARLVVHEHALFAKQSIDQRGLARVGLAHEGEANRRFGYRSRRGPSIRRIPVRLGFAAHGSHGRI